jgi:hypothetical protein
MLRRHIRAAIAILAVAAVATTPTPATAHDTGAPTLANPGFEADAGTATPTGWSERGDVNASCWCCATAAGPPAASRCR